MGSSAYLSKTERFWRWLAFAAAAIVVSGVTLTVLWWSFFSGVRSDSIGLGLLIGGLCFCVPSVLAAIAPIGRGWVAWISLCLVCAASWFGMNGPSVSFVTATLIGGGSAILLASWKELPFGHSLSRGKLLALLAVIVSCIALGGGILRFMDIPAFTDPLPGDIVEMLPKGVDKPTKVNVYDLGGFLDSAFLIRIDASPSTITALGKAIGKQTNSSPGKTFFSFAPYWWPRKMPAGGKVYRTLDQPFSTYPGDGTFYTMLVDRTDTRAWIHVFHGF